MFVWDRNSANKCQQWIMIECIILNEENEPKWERRNPNKYMIAVWLAYFATFSSVLYASIRCVGIWWSNIYDSYEQQLGIRFWPYLPTTEIAKMEKKSIAASILHFVPIRMVKEFSTLKNFARWKFRFQRQMNHFFCILLKFLIYLRLAQSFSFDLYLFWVLSLTGSWV